MALTVADLIDILSTQDEDMIVAIEVETYRRLMDNVSLGVVDDDNTIGVILT